ncbi:hypothetical protein C7B62_09815 [Pleurocapsa sp. CCALA 161]|uniref:hypothetical protein n=1 Tax=Pleurocapsa sp. CCALA 161 TaxID=2107688 RepID=UPI000D05FE5A|nr:hypothetical protein [Pleurocapsa sp. CCALA 161]PSB10305.1 hypothetical protein C7B62_09815 [Pleurocapsa sp. CCALA 161]
MKLLLLKILLQRRARDEGFTLPMVIAIGLVMILLGTINIVKSSEENITAISQNSSADAMAVAEVGIIKYRELLNQNRILTVYNEDQWTSTNVAGQTCANMATAPTGWTGTATLANDTAATATDTATTDNDNWWEINEDFNGDGDTTDDGEFVGEYRLVSYEYDIDGLTGTADSTADNNDFDLFSDADKDDDPGTLASGVTVNSITDENDTDDDGQSDAVGILTVQGRSPDGGIAQIETKIPLRINDLENFAPVLWVESGAIATPGTLNIPNADDNIVLKSSGTGCSTPAAIAGNTNVISDPRNLPAIISLPTDSTKKNSIGTIDTTSSKITLPTPSVTPDNKNDQGRFLYEVSTINVATNNLETDGIAKVTLYATGNINITGASGTTITIGNSNAANPNTKAACVDPASTATPPALLSFANFNCANTISTSVSSQNLEIYGSSTTTQIDINTNGGTVNIESFIHAPDATLNISGGGTVNINGAVWVNSFNNTSTTVNVRSDKTDTTTAAEASYKFYTTSATMTPRPLTSTPTDWVREEVQ